MLRMIRRPKRPVHRPVEPEDLRSRTLVVGLGAMKSGTTWLSGYLAAHSRFLHSPIKEMNTFNQFYDNPFKGQRDRFRLYRMESLLLDKRPGGMFRHEHRLRALAQLGRINSVEDYLAYFAERIGEETHFGEISPSYSHLPPEALRDIAGITSDVRFLFLMRDPAARAASHIRHLRRRVRAHVPVADLVAQVTPDDAVYMRSDYGHTLDTLDRAGLRDRARLLYFETLFRPETMRGLCDWLDLEFREPEADRKRNVGVGEGLTPEQMHDLRDRLDPIYVDLRARGLGTEMAGWWWDAQPAAAV